MNEPLLPCPFCGSNELDNDGHRIKCEKCWAESPQMHSYPVPNPEYVLEAWNSRTPPPPSVKWPEKKGPVISISGNALKFPYNNGWNACLEAFKELNAPKGEPDSREIVLHVNDINWKPIDEVIKRELENGK